MARKIGNTRNPSTDGQHADDLDVLHPERELTFPWGKLVVREYGGVEWMRLRSLARPIIDRLAALMEAGVPATYETALDVLADHMDAVVTLLAHACDESIETIGTLSPVELDDVLLFWWGANGRFFIHRAANAVAVSQAEARLERSAGVSSTQPSSPTDTDSTTSAATPTDS